MTDATTTLRWAVRSKTPGSQDGYVIIADDSGGDNREFYARQLLELVPGNPTTAEAGLPNALPWVAIAPLIGGGQTQRVAVATLEWPAEVILDATTRPATVSRYFDVGYAELTTAGVSYTGLFAELDRLGVPTSPDAAVTLRVADPDQIAADIDGFGFDAILVAAAALLEGSVVVTGAGVPTALVDRLRYLDAVAALLPYGVRADLAVGTWSPNRGTQPLRLFFSDNPTGNQRTVAYGDSSPGVTFVTGVAADYADRAGRVRRLVGTAGVVRALWGERTPIRFDHPAAALDALANLDRPYAMWQDIRRGAAGAAEISTMLEADSLPPAEPTVWRDLVRCLIERGTDTQLRPLARHWSPAVSAELAVAVGGFNSPERGQTCLAVAVDAHALDMFGVDLLAVAATSPVEMMRIAHVLARQAVSAAPRLRSAMLAQPEFTVRLLMICSAFVPKSLRPWLTFLLGGPSDVRPDWLGAFEAVVRGRPISDQEVQRAHAASDRTLLALLAVAFSHGRLDLFVGSVRAWGEVFNDLRHGDDRLRQDLRAVADRPGQQLPGHVRAPLDLLIIASGAEPTWPQSGLPSGILDYQATVVERLSRVPAEWLASTVDTLLASLIRTGLTKQRTDFLIRIANDITDQAVKLRAFTTIADAAAIDPGVLIGQPPPIVERLKELSPDLKGRSVVFELGPAARNNTAPEELGRLSGRAIVGAVPLSVVLDHIQPWPGWEDPILAFRLLRTMSQLAGSRNDGFGTEIYHDCLVYVLAGGYGIGPARRLRQHLRQRATVEARRRQVERKVFRKVKPPKDNNRRRRPRWLFGSAKPSEITSTTESRRGKL